MDQLLVAYTPLGEKWWASHLEGSEGLSSLYEFRLELKSEESDIDIQSIIGNVCAVECKTNSSPARYFSGHVIGAAAKGRSGKKGESSTHWFYELRIAPKLWFASQRADFRIWQGKTVQDIASNVLGDNGITCKWSLRNNYEPLEYVVQYGETDLAFLLRLFGHEGIYFWFEHSKKNGETLILGDHLSFHKEFDGYKTIHYHPPGATHYDEDHFTAWHASRTAKTGTFVHTNYDFKSPSKNLKTEFANPVNHPSVIFAYPGTHTESEQGKKYATTRLEGLQTGHNVIVLEGPVRGAVPGCLFELKKHPVESQNREFLITKAEYEVQNNDQENNASQILDRAPNGVGYNVKVWAMPHDQQYRAPRESFEMPRAHGPDTAVVVGREGHEIDTDKYGRVKVHFHWDRHGKDSCWIRVAHPWAGSNFGSIHIPRIGQEVIVDYEQGNPERPIITGCVYNDEQRPPWTLPDNKTQSGILTRSSPGGTPENRNELRFEDKKDGEQVWLHAERNLDIEAKADETHIIGKNRTKIIGRSYEKEEEVGNETTTVFGNRTETVHKDENIAIHRDRTKIIGNPNSKTGGNEQTFVYGNRTETVLKNETITVKKDRTEIVEGSESITIQGMGRYQHVNYNEVNFTGVSKTDVVVGASFDVVGAARLSGIGGAWVNGIGGAYVLGVGLAMETFVAKDQTTTVKGDRTINVDKNQITTVKENTELYPKNYIVQAKEGIELVGEKTLKLRGTKGLELSCGKSSIVMTSDGIFLKSDSIHLSSGMGGVNIDGGPNVKINTGSAKSGKILPALKRVKKKEKKSSPPPKQNNPPNIKKAMGFAGGATGAAGMAMGMLNKATEVVSTVTAAAEAIKGGPAGGLSSASDSSSGNPATAGSASPLDNPAVKAIASMAPTLARVFE